MDRADILWILFAAVSGGLVAISWRSLRVFGSHGFIRFFAWEAILGLVLINSHAWFRNPWPTLQIISWLCLCVSLLMLGSGLHRLGVSGKAGQTKPGSRREDPTLFPFERTTELVTTGIYGLIRHPLYSSLLFLAWGAFLKEISWASGLLVAAATLLLRATARADESECIRHFGPPYEEYMKRSKMFIPYLW